MSNMKITSIIKRKTQDQEAREEKHLLKIVLKNNQTQKVLLTKQDKVHLRLRIDVC